MGGHLGRWGQVCVSPAAVHAQQLGDSEVSAVPAPDTTVSAELKRKKPHDYRPLALEAEGQHRGCWTS